MNDKVTSIKSRLPAPPKPPDCLILSARTSFLVDGVMRTWEANVPITDARDIELLEGQPAERFHLMPSPPSPSIAS